MQLRDMPELDCFTTQNLPMGQIYVKGNAVFKGYFKDPEKTKEVIDEQGWMKIGDIGKLLPNGAIEIIDRVGELRKLQNGQFIAPQKLEAIYSSCPLIAQICIEINSNENYLVAIVTVDQEKLMAFAQVNGLEGDFDSLVR